MEIDQLASYTTEQLEEELKKRARISDEIALAQEQSLKWETFRDELLEEIDNESSCMLNVIAEMIFRFVDDPCVLTSSAYKLYKADCLMMKEVELQRQSEALFSLDQFIESITQNYGPTQGEFLKHYKEKIRPHLKLSAYK